MIISDLQLNLIAAGAAAVAAVWGYNLWQERKYRKAAEQVFRDGRQDAVAPEPATEPEDGRDLTAEVDLDGERLEPVFAEAKAESTGTADQAEPDETLADPTIQLVVSFRFERTVSGKRLLEFNDGLSGRLVKRLQWVVRDNESGGWQILDGNDSGSYRDLRATLPLADRQGALADGELAAFVAAAGIFARDNGGEFSPPAAGEWLAHARALDELCASVDVQVAVHVVHRSGGSFACTKLRGLAEAAGLLLAADGNFYCVDEAGAPLFSLANDGAAPFNRNGMQNAETQGMTFWLDVPRVAEGALIFDRLVAAARLLANGLDGVLVDDQRGSLTDDLLAGIRARIVDIQMKMAQSGLPAGGRRALQLFA